MKIVNLEEVIKKDDLYHCGSLNLKKFLESNGLSPIDSYTKKDTKKKIFLFIKCYELSTLLAMWSENKRKKGGD